ncbi:MAG: gamma carbonic anhydrase family protein [bacterium]|nr:gamma carbonic anhydrase family protein [bacterium]MDT8396568.1 gamma carbonic anhydrase family protein [bacterium]
MSSFPFFEKEPTIGKDVFIAPTATVIGDVTVGDDAGIWFGTVVRGDVNWIRIGSRTNIQDGSILHVTTDRFPLEIGDRVSVGHGAVVHGCTIHEECLIGLGSRILDGATIGTGSIVGAGALVTEGQEVPPGQLVLGVPSRVIRTVSEKERDRILRTAAHYVKLKDTYINSGL